MKVVAANAAIAGRLDPPVVHKDRRDPLDPRVRVPRATEASPDLLDS